MPATIEKGCADPIVESQDEDHDQDLFDDLSRRLDCLWRYDQYIANTDGRTELQEFWQSSKSQEQKNIDQLRKLIQQNAHVSGFAVVINERK